MNKNPETVFINFKGLGKKASLNKADFDPKIHKLWTAKDEARANAPLLPEPEEVNAEDIDLAKKVGRPAKIRG